MRKLFLLLALAACTTGPTAPTGVQVAQVILYQDTVNLLMTDGSLCAVDRPGRAMRWQGATEGCPHAFNVTVMNLPTAPRQVLRPGGELILVAGQGWG